jgi:hypothetical protein
VIIMGGILSGWFTPTEAGMMAAVYMVVLIPVLNRGHQELPRLMYAGLLYRCALPPSPARPRSAGWSRTDTSSPAKSPHSPAPTAR